MTRPTNRVGLRRGIESIIDGPFGSNLAGEHYADHGARVIRLGNIGTMSFRDADKAYIGLDYFEGLRRHAVTSGDILVAGLGDENHAVGRACVAPDSLGPALVKADCFRLRPRPDVFDGRYIAWFLNSADAEHQIAMESRGATRIRATPDAIANISAPVPTLFEQRRIADFLDDQVTRIDNVIASRARQAALCDAELTARLRMLLLQGPAIPARRFFREAVVGIVVQPAQYYVSADEPGVPTLRGLNVSERTISTKSLVRISARGHQLHPRSQLHTGDIVVVRTGDAGAASVVPAWADDWNAIDLVIVRANAKADPRYLMHALNANRRSQSIAAASSGSIQQHFGVNAIGDLPIVLRDLVEQTKVSTSADQAYSRRDEGITQQRASIQLMQEFKRSLITAAVTGQFDVSTADGSGVQV